MLASGVLAIVKALQSERDSNEGFKKGKVGGNIAGTEFIVAILRRLTMLVAVLVEFMAEWISCYECFGKGGTDTVCLTIFETTKESKNYNSKGFASPKASWGKETGFVWVGFWLAGPQNQVSAWSKIKDDGCLAMRTREALSTGVKVMESFAEAREIALEVCEGACTNELVIPEEGDWLLACMKVLGVDIAHICKL
ncbi:hypothetical protein AA313_de0205887 [Arthrobotrys entomopaga]|nr:hypothetical protein AA313_de0205887 [Arthrobotrys entomopaga]